MLRGNFHHSISLILTNPAPHYPQLPHSPCTPSALSWANGKVARAVLRPGLFCCPLLLLHQSPTQEKGLIKSSPPAMNRELHFHHDTQLSDVLMGTLEGMASLARGPRRLIILEAVSALALAGFSLSLSISLSLLTLEIY